MHSVLPLLSVVASLGADAPIEAVLAITQAATKPILSPGALFGSFYEDFLHSGDGGAYAEKLSNRALALPLSNTTSFRCSGTKGSEDCTWYVCVCTTNTSLSSELSHIGLLGKNRLLQTGGESCIAVYIRTLYIWCTLQPPLCTAVLNHWNCFIGGEIIFL